MSLAGYAGPLVLLGAASIGWADPSYPRAELLIEPATLARARDPQQPVVLDAREKAKYEAGHIPGALWVDHADWSKAFGASEGGDLEGWQKRIGALGIEPNSAVVVYDDNLQKDAARIWWILRFWGLDRVRLLNGGWKGWTEASLPVETQANEPKAETFPALVRTAARLANQADLLATLEGNKLQIVDARSEDEHCGVEKMKNARGGAIPGAKHLEWSDLIEPETQRFKSAEELSQLFSAAGIDLIRPTATHCQSGGRASVMAFGMELMGAEPVRNYYRGWSEWGNSNETPVEPGEKQDETESAESPQ